MNYPGTKLLSKYIIAGFLAGSVSIVPQLLILSGVVTPNSRFTMLVITYSFPLLFIVPLAFVLAAIAIALIPYLFTKNNKKLFSAGDENNKLNLKLSQHNCTQGFYNASVDRPNDRNTFMTHVVDESANMVCVIDENDNIAYINKKLKQFFNIDTNHLMSTVKDAISGLPEFNALTGNLEKNLPSREKYSVHECKITDRRTGVDHWFKVQKTTFTDNDTKNFISIIATDISMRIVAEEELMSARHAAETSLKMRENFIANMSHEIRTPLNAIIGFSELLRLTVLDSEQADYLNTIKIAGQNLLGIINDILDLSKLESGNIVISKNRMNIHNVLLNVKKLFEPKIREKQIELVIDIAPDIPDALLSDEMRLNQVLINLVGNAIKFTETGKIEIIVTSVVINNNGTMNLQFQVKDSGIGIEKDKLDVIFQRYTQASQDIHKVYGGTGLGLSISKSLIELLGGEIKLSSEKGVGTTFSFSIPFELTTDKEPPTPMKSSGVLESPPLKILLAEDNLTNAKLAIHVLKKTNHHVHHVTDGMEVLKELTKRRYDIILMDVQMVHMDGIEAAKIIRSSNQLYKDIPIIALTAHSFQGEKDVCKQAGMNAYLSKPYHPEELISCLNKTMGTLRQKQNESFSSLVEAGY